MKKQISLLFFALSAALPGLLQAGPVLPPGSPPKSKTVYQARLTCNGGDPTIFQVQPKGDLILVTIGKDPGEPMSIGISPVIETTEADGTTVFTSQFSGTLKIDSKGEGIWSYDKTVAVTDSGGTHLFTQKMQVNVSCRWIAPPPSGFSVGN